MESPSPSTHSPLPLTTISFSPLSSQNVLFPEAPLRVLVGPFRRLFTRRRPSVEKALDEAAPSLYNPL